MQRILVRHWSESFQLSPNATGSVGNRSSTNRLPPGTSIRSSSSRLKAAVGQNNTGEASAVRCVGDQAMRRVELRLLPPLVYLDHRPRIVVVAKRSAGTASFVNGQQLLVILQIGDHAHGQVFWLLFDHDFRSPPTCRATSTRVNSPIWCLLLRLCLADKSAAPSNPGASNDKTTARMAWTLWLESILEPSRKNAACGLHEGMPRLKHGKKCG